MIGNGYTATGITVAWAYSGMGQYGWCATVDYIDAGFCDDVPGTTQISTEGTLRTRYQVRDTEDGASSLPFVIDVIKADAERLGITFADDLAAVWYRRDGGDSDCPPPDDWRELLNEQSRRLGWREGYSLARSELGEKDNGNE